MSVQSRLGPLHLIEQIAEGGMGQVFRAKAKGHPTPIAVKVMHGRLVNDPVSRELFAREAKLASRVRHPHVVGVLDAGVAKGVPWLAMELVDGVSLLEVLLAAQRRSASVPRSVALGIVDDLLQGLEALHAHRGDDGVLNPIVHRDISPSNLLVDRSGLARLIDFGIARVVEQTSELTEEGVLRGKLSYLAPEQLNGEVSPATDLYAAAVVAWELLTQQKFIDAPTPQARVSQVLTREPPAPSSVNPSVPVALDAVILRGLARFSAARWPTGSAFRQALAPFGRATSREIAAWVSGLQPPRLEPKPVDDATVMMFEPGPGPRRWLVPVAAGVVTLTAAGLMLVVRMEPPDLPATRALPAPTLTVAPQPPPALAPPLSVPEVIAPDAGALVEAVVDPPKAAPIARSRKRAPSKQPRRCEPPFFFDSRGVKRYRPECL